jgi:hypothetical protein
MIKLWNLTTQLTPLNNYLNNCVISSSYTPTLTPSIKLHSAKNCKNKTILPKKLHGQYWMATMNTKGCNLESLKSLHFLDFFLNCFWEHNNFSWYIERPEKAQQHTTWVFRLGEFKKYGTYLMFQVPTFQNTN